MEQATPDRVRYRRVTIRTPWGQFREPEAGELVLHMATTRKGATAWGFGSHPTTSLATSMLLGLYQEGAPNPRRVLDVGCGTGILSILCSRLGASEVRGIDINPDAKLCAAHNAEENGAANCTFDDTPVADVPGTFDLVVANLPSQAILSDLCTALSACAKGGLLLCSGFKAEGLRELIELYQQHGMRHLYSCEREDVTTEEGVSVTKVWCAALFKSKV